MVDDPLASFDGPPTLTRRSAAIEEQEPFAMVPRQVILCCRDPMCLALYTYLDLRQGQYGPPPHGLQHIADNIGITYNTLKVHLEHLVEDGFARVTPKLGTLSATESKRQAIVEVIHNPSRRRMAHNATRTATRNPRAKKKSKYSGRGQSGGNQEQEEPKPPHKENRTVPRELQDVRKDVSRENLRGIPPKIAGHPQPPSGSREPQSWALQTEAELIASLERAFGKSEDVTELFCPRVGAGKR
jgi:hypothetical protein